MCEAYLPERVAARSHSCRTLSGSVAMLACSLVVTLLAGPAAADSNGQAAGIQADAPQLSIRPWMPVPEEAWPRPPRGRSTGQTTGHIADLSLTNHGQTEARAVIGPFLIPSNGRDQPYLVPGQTEIVVPADSTVVVPIYGYCADIHRPPVPAGEDMPPVSEWIEIGEMDPESDWAPAPEQGWVAIEEQAEGSVQVLLPGTDRPLGHTIDIDRYPAEAAPLLLTGALLIEEAYEELQSAEAIRTPFSARPEQEREAVIQQTLWIFAAGLTGAAYKLEDFRANTVSQFEESSGTEFDQAPAEVREQVEAGVLDFWNTFKAVGAEAKVLPAVPEPGIDAPTAMAASAAVDEVAGEWQQQRIPVSDKRPRCQCGELSFRVTASGPGGLSSSKTFTDPNPGRGAELKFADAIETLRPQNPSDLKVTIDQIRCQCACQVEVETGDGEATTESQSCDQFFPDAQSAAAGDNAGQASIRVANNNRGNWTAGAENDKGVVVGTHKVTASSFSKTYRLENTKPKLDDEKTPFEHELAVTLKLVCGGNEQCDNSARCGRKYRITIKER